MNDKKIKKTELIIRQYLDETFKRLTASNNKKVWSTEAHIIAAVKDETLFCLVECDINVPEDTKKHFAEMPPICLKQRYF